MILQISYSISIFEAIKFFVVFFVFIIFYSRIMLKLTVLEQNQKILEKQINAIIQLRNTNLIN